MSKNQAKDYDVKEEQRSYYVQVDVPKINYSMPIEKKWLVRMDGGVLVEKFGGFEKANIDKTPQTKPQKLNENKTYSEDEVF